MAFDGLVVSALVHELSNMLEYNRIEKIYQPETDEIIINIRSQYKSFKLLLSANSSYPRIHFTNVNKENPSTPPNFCMLLRKYLQGGKIVDIIQPNFERIIKLKIETLDELNSLKYRELIIEMMGRHSNIILIDVENNKILDSIKRISLDISRYRQILPGLKYTLPPSQNKYNPLSIKTVESLKEILSSSLQVSVIKALYSKFTGISPLIAREICYLADIDGDNLLTHMSEEDYQQLYQSTYSLLQAARNNSYTPIIYYDHLHSKYIDFAVIKLHHIAHYQEQEQSSVSEMLESFYTNRDHRERIKQKSYDLRKNITTKLDRLYNKIQNLHQDLRKAERADIYRLKGELLTTNLHQIKKGQDTVELINYYDENAAPVMIELDKRLTPSQNAQSYYKRYNKAKNALHEVAKQLEKSKAEIDYLEQVIVNIDQSTYLSDLEEIHNELIETGYSKKRPNKKKIASYKKVGHLKYMSSDGLEILVGKNNKQNDEITFKIADKEDLWFHVKDRPGSHVVLKLSSNPYSDTSILEAATLAAYYSKVKNTTKVAVDYTQRKNVKKTKGAKPGMVIYENYSTVLVDGDERSVQNIKQLD